VRWCYYDAYPMCWFVSQRTRSGFALPTLLIASVVMLIILSTAVSAVGVTRVALNDQYYNQIAREAAESGANRAVACMAQDSGSATWSNNGDNLYPNSNCDGTILAGASAYTLSTPSLRASYTVGTVVSQNASLKVNVTSTAEVLRATSDASVWRTYATDTVVNVPLGVVSSTYSASGTYEVCGIIDAQTWCWGHNDKGQLGNGLGGDGTTTYDSAVPVRAARVAGALQGKMDKFVVVGNLYACIVTTDNLVYCMGNNMYGMLGDGTTTNRNTPTAVDTTTGLAGKTITDIAATDSHVCVVASGDVYCWGSGGYGRMGNGGTTNQLSPSLVSTIGASNGKPVVQVATTVVMASTCAVLADGTAWCWGRNDRGQLGDQTTTTRLSPVPVYMGGALAGKTIIDIAMGGGSSVSSPTDGSTADKTNRGTTCAATSDGGDYCWGSDQYGQIGRGTSTLTPQTSPVLVGGALAGKKVVQVGMAYATPCALTDTGVMYCWGQNTNGQVGDGTTTVRYTPTAVTVSNPGLLGHTISYISGGANRNCAIADGATYCWGYNGDGQIGDGTFITRTVPTEATFLRRRLPAIYF
jgi:alpha-tubulin suppressor-like RCC1 family protein